MDKLANYKQLSDEIWQKKVIGVSQKIIVLHSKISVVDRKIFENKMPREI